MPLSTPKGLSVFSFQELLQDSWGLSAKMPMHGLHPQRRRAKMCPPRNKGQDVSRLHEGNCRKDSMLVKLGHESDQRKEVGKHARDPRKLQEACEGRQGALELTLPEGRLYLPGEDLPYYPRSA